jgi:hypothetical protein
MILPDGILLDEEDCKSDVFDVKLDLREFVKNTGQDATSIANKVYDRLENVLVNDREAVRPMRKTHVSLFDESQMLLETHYEIQAFLFRCIRAWLCKKQKGTTIGVFSGTSSAILNFTIQTDLLTDDNFDATQPSRGLKDYKDYFSRGSKTFEPLFTLTTTAVLKQMDQRRDQSEYGKSIPYGRPLFAKMHENDRLEQNIETILRRLLLDTGKECFQWRNEKKSWLSVLATRVQMGSTNLAVASNLVAKGYANLTGVYQNFASFVFMPDPVCARLAMCMLDENWRLGSLKGKSTNWWSQAVKSLYSTGLCLPDKGTVGEVLTALYFRFCCDECRQSLNKRQ